MKKIVFSLAIILSVVAVAGAVSYAGWNDTDTSKDNVITAGRLELEWTTDIDPNKDGDYSDAVWTTEAPKVIDVAGKVPGDKGNVVVYVRNAGNSVDGVFTVENVKFTDKDADGVSTGQLSQFVNWQFQMTQDDGGVAGRVDELAKVVSPNNRWHFGADNSPKDPVTLTKNGEAHALTINWEFVDKATGTNGALLNDTMGDSVFVDFDGVLTQK